MTAAAPYGLGTRMLTLDELCEWLNITERHARKLVERDAIPYRKVGHLLRSPKQRSRHGPIPSATGQHRPFNLSAAEFHPNRGESETVQYSRSRLSNKPAVDSLYLKPLPGMQRQ